LWKGSLVMPTSSLRPLCQLVMVILLTGPIGIGILSRRALPQDGLFFLAMT